VIIWDHDALRGVKTDFATREVDKEGHTLMKDLRTCTTRPLLPFRILLPTFAFLVASPAMAATNFIVWTSPSAGSGGEISATVTSTVTAGALSAVTFNASDGTFISDFAASYSALHYASPASGPANIGSTISFSRALPIGAKLIAVDVDYMGESLSLSSNGSPLSLLEQRETINGANSFFPAYNAGTGVLSETAPDQNANEASVFDVSGLSVIDVHRTGGNTNSGTGVAIALPITPVGVEPHIPAQRLRLRVRRNPTTVPVQFVLAAPAEVGDAIELFDLRGRRVGVVQVAPGGRDVQWDWREEQHRAGVYFARQRSGSEAVRFVILR
jgi:hypothetical protein